MRRRQTKWLKFTSIMALSTVLLSACGSSESSSGSKNDSKKPVELLNVSYDPTRELYQDFNKEFTEYWKNKTDQTVTVKQSHGGSGSQGRAVIDGLQADVVTLALAYDIDEIAKTRHILPENWQTKLKDNSTPYTSTIVFLVRKGNPKGIKDWDDLTKKGVSVITPNPKTSGGARWNYLAAWAYADKQDGGKEKETKAFMKKLYQNVEVLDSGARGATTTFVERGIGDVLIAWENEALLTQQELGKDKFDIVVPSLSILAEPPVAVVDKNAEKKGTKKVAKAYLNYLYTEKGQEIAAKHFYRPRNEKVLAKYSDVFPKVDLVTVDKEFGGWKKAQAKHFDDGGTFDDIYQPK
ncbi:sulfate ABC transporter substrate-binding protein [Priestia koreensis]|uniref:sulfate ABC transporter substrate-binding protein n=1 Tax=Priestia koreensis TaxID=284581 RepID=UPI00203E4D85|nr:sulfate ABC transporter substrate-binding protein [Priestia koreensis]MCM3004214.1 sulfate ABC transporter substrate-binding protein [Priestia koreensis]